MALEGGGADLDKTNDHSATPLMRAGTSGHSAAVRQLLALGAYHADAGAAGSALRHAEASGHGEVANVLRRHARQHRRAEQRAAREALLREQAARADRPKAKAIYEKLLSKDYQISVGT